MSIKTRQQIIETVADLANIQPGDGDVIEVLGYNSIGDGGGQLLRYDASSADAVNNGFVFYGPGLLGRYIAIDQEQANVRCFGAVGDGVTNDNAAIQAALSSGAKIVFLPTGTYLVSTNLTLNANQTIKGDGPTNSILQIPQDGFVGSVIGMSNRSVIHDISIQETNADPDKGTTAICYGISNGTSSNTLIRNVYIKGLHIPFLAQDSGGTATDVRFENCEASHARAWGFEVDGSKNVSYENCLSYNNGLDGFKAQNDNNKLCENLVYQNCTAHNNGQRDTAAGGSESTNGNGWDLFQGGYRTRVVNCSAYENYGGGFIIKGETTAPIMGECVFNNCQAYRQRTSSSGAQSGFEVNISGSQRGSRSVFSECQAYENPNSGFLISGGSQLRISNCTSVLNQYGLRLASQFESISVDGCVVSGNWNHNVLVGNSDSGAQIEKVVTFDRCSIWGQYDPQADVNTTMSEQSYDRFDFTADSGTDIITISGHTFSDGDRVALIEDNTLPTGLAEETWYYVINATANTLQLSLTKGGSAVDIVDNGTGTNTMTGSIGEGVRIYSDSANISFNNCDLGAFSAGSGALRINGEGVSLNRCTIWNTYRTAIYIPSSGDVKVRDCRIFETQVNKFTGTGWGAIRVDGTADIAGCHFKNASTIGSSRAICFQSGSRNNRFGLNTKTNFSELLRVFSGATFGNDQVFDVTYFGALGDGAADDTAEIQATLDSNGLNVVIPEGTYNISSQLTVNEGQTITGTGTLKKTVTGDWAIFYIASNYVTIDGLVSEGADTGPSGELLSGFAHINAATGCNIYNCRVTKVDGAGIILTDADNCTIDNNFLFDSSTTNSSAADILLRGNCNGVKITNNHCGSDCNAGIYAGFTPGDSDLIISNNHCVTLNASGGENNAPAIRRHGILAHYTAAGTSSRMIVSDNVIRHTKWAGIYCNGNSDKIQIHDNQISHTAIDYGGGSPLAGGIMINGDGRFISVQGNMISDVGDSMGGIRVTPSPDVGGNAVDSYVFIHANTIDDCPDRAIHVGGYASRVMISKNMIVGTSIAYSGGDPANAPYGIYVAPQAGITPDDLTIDGNFITMPTFGFAMYINWDDSPTKQPVITNNILRCIDNVDGNRQNSAGVLMRRYHGIINNNSIEGFSVGVRIFEQIDPGVRGYRVEHNKIKGEWAFGASASAGNTDRIMFFGTSNKVEVTGSIFKDSANLGRAAGTFGDLQGDGTVIVTDSALPTYGTYVVGDRVVNSSPSIGGVSEWLCTSGGTPGAWTEVRQSDVINVKDYGATGDGVTNDTSGIEAAFAAVPAGGATVLFPPGTYITNVLQVSTHNTTLKGDSATLTASGGVVLQISGRDCTVDSLIIDGNLTAGQGINVFDGADRACIKYCEVYDIQDSGLTADGIKVGYCTNIDISNNYIHDISTLDGSPSRGIRFASSDPSGYVSGICSHNKIDHIYPQDDGDGIVVQTYPVKSQLVISDNVLTRCAKRAIKTQSEGVIIANNMCTMTNVGGGSNPRSAITAQSSYSTITGNQLTVTAIDAAIDLGNSNASYLNVCGNTITFINTGANCDGILVSTGAISHFAITGNTFAGTHRFGIKIDDDASHGTITGNSFDNMLNHGIQFGGTVCEDITIVGNVITNLTGFSVPINYNGGGVPARVHGLSTNVYDGSATAITNIASTALRAADSTLVIYGTGTPEGNYNGAIGHRYIRTDGGTGTTLYLKESGTGNTGWIAK